MHTGAGVDEDCHAAARQVLDGSKFVWVVVGDASVVRPQLATVNMPIEDMRLTTPAPAPAAAAAPAATGPLPRCSATVTDRCVQRGGR